MIQEILTVPNLPERFYLTRDTEAHREQKLYESREVSKSKHFRNQEGVASK